MPCKRFALFQLIPSKTSVSVCNPQATFTITIKQDGNTSPGGVLNVHTQAATLSFPNPTGVVNVSIPSANLIVDEKITFTLIESFSAQEVLDSPVIDVIECIMPEIKTPVEICLNSLVGTPLSFLDDPTMKSYPDVTSVKWEPEGSLHSSDVLGVFDWAIKVEFSGGDPVILPFSATIVTCQPVPLNEQTPTIDPVLVVFRTEPVPDAFTCITNAYELNGVANIKWTSVYSTAVLGTFTWELQVIYEDGTIDFVPQVTKVIANIGADENVPVAVEDLAMEQLSGIPPASSAVANLSSLINVKSVEWEELVTTNCQPDHYTWNVIIAYWNNTQEILPIPVTIVPNYTLALPEFWKIVYRNNTGANLTNCLEISEFMVHVSYLNGSIITNDYSKLKMQIVLDPALPITAPGNLTPLLPCTSPDDPGLETHLTIHLDKYSEGAAVAVVLTFTPIPYYSQTFTGFTIEGGLVHQCTT